jgi:acetyl-CoA carboxylase biotin carboxyl carrier protein
MKVFNEIKAEISGTVEKILVNSGQAVEFGQPLFLVRPA